MLEDSDVFWAAETAIENSRQLILCELKLLANAVLHRKVAALLRTPCTRDHATIVLEPSEKMVALTGYEAELLHKSVEVGSLDHSGILVLTTALWSPDQAVFRSGPSRSLDSSREKYS